MVTTTSSRRILQRSKIFLFLVWNAPAALEFAKEILLALRAAPENIIQQWYHFHELDYYNTSISYVKMEMRKNVN